MVVLEDVSMLTTGHNQYLQPDYLSPVPPTQLDAKKSPLALLAQTCSQIGADSPTKPLLSSLDKPSKGSSSGGSARSPPAAKLERTRGSPSDGKASSNSNLAFKPYETNVVSIKRSSGDESSSRPGSKASSVHSASGHDSAVNSASDDANNNNSSSSNSNNSSNSSSKKSASRSTPQGRKTASPSQPSAASNRSSPSGQSERKTPGEGRDKSSASPRTSSGASPIIRSGMEILSGHGGGGGGAGSKDPGGLYKSAFGTSPLCCPPGFQQPFPGSASAAAAFSHQQHASAVAALFGGHYPGVTSASTPASNPFLSYARVKTSAGGETLVPVCKDPYCTGCQYSMHNAQLMMAASACPSGCTQCDHQKYSSLMGLSGLGPMAPPPALAGYPLHSSPGRPHVCSWMAGDSFCGKRFASGEELLQHLRTHTTGGAPGDPAAAAGTAALLASGQHGGHPLLTSTAALHRAAQASAAAGSYPELGARYHPYGKPPAGPPLPASLAASPYSAFNPLTPYYSPYALYGQRMGAAVHP